MLSDNVDWQRRMRC